MTTTVKITLHYDAGFNCAVLEKHTQDNGTVVDGQLHKLEPLVEQTHTIWDSKKLEIVELGVNYKKVYYE